MVTSVAPWLCDQPPLGPSIPAMVEACLELDVKMVACTPTLEMTGVTKADLIEGVEVGGAADYLDFALDANINLFV